MRNEQDQALAALPSFPRGESTAWSGLRVNGLVRHPVTWSQRALESLPQVKLAQDFRCEEGWVVPDQQWEGPRVADLLELSEPLPDAWYVALSAGEFAVALSLEEVTESGAIIALRLNGAALPDEHGGPCRLVVPGKTCYYSVKWMDQLLVLTERPKETGKEIALGRIWQDSGSGAESHRNK